MSTIGLVILIGLVGGLAVGLQQPLSSLLAGRMGMLEGLFIVQLGGTLATLVLLLTLRRGSGLKQWHDLPWYGLGAGVLSVVIISAVSYAIPRVGTVTSTFLIVTGQLVASIVIDHYGLFDTSIRQLDPSRLLGVGVLFAGIWLIVR